MHPDYMILKYLGIQHTPASSVAHILDDYIFVNKSLLRWDRIRILWIFMFAVITGLDRRIPDCQDPLDTRQEDLGLSGSSRHFCLHKTRQEDTVRIL